MGLLSHTWFPSSIGTYTHLLRELVAEFTLTDNPANTTTSLLRAMCHVDDSVILGSWLQETDHKAIEDQVRAYVIHGNNFILVLWGSIDCLYKFLYIYLHKSYRNWHLILTCTMHWILFPFIKFLLQLTHGLMKPKFIEAMFEWMHIDPNLNLQSHFSNFGILICTKVIEQSGIMFVKFVFAVFSLNQIVKLRENL